jgi:hypothetical protein
MVARLCLDSYHVLSIGYSRVVWGRRSGSMAQLFELLQTEVRSVDSEEYGGEEIGSCHLKAAAGCEFSVSSLAWLLADHTCRVR